MRFKRVPRIQSSDSAGSGPERMPSSSSGPERSPLNLVTPNDHRSRSSSAPDCVHPPPMRSDPIADRVHHLTPHSAHTYGPRGGPPSSPFGGLPSLSSGTSRSSMDSIDSRRATYGPQQAHSASASPRTTRSATPRTQSEYGGSAGALEQNIVVHVTSPDASQATAFNFNVLVNPRSATEAPISGTPPSEHAQHAGGDDDYQPSYAAVTNSTVDMTALATARALNEAKVKKERGAPVSTDEAEAAQTTACSSSEQSPPRSSQIYFHPSTEHRSSESVLLAVSDV
jgi:hypothetical protein